jgi:hypothetical protein
MELRERRHNLSNVELGKRMVISVWVEKARHEQVVVEKGRRVEREKVEKKRRIYLSKETITSRLRE